MENEINKKRKLSQKLKDRYRLVIFNEDTIETVWQGILSRMNFIIWIGLIGIFLIALGIVIVSFTPLREYIPGYPDGNIKGLLISNRLKVDSLAKEIDIRDQYIININSILKGEETNSFIENTDTTIKTQNINFDKKQFDSTLASNFEHEQKYGISNFVEQPKRNEFQLNKLHLFCPVQGSITNKFNATENHFGIDIASNLKEPVLSVLSGTVTFIGWTLETGYVIIVQHNYNIMSIYKHNSQLLKKAGDRVIAGEPIAIIGNTGEYTTGPHLHFELWHNGQALNPSDYIVF